MVFWYLPVGDPDMIGEVDGMGTSRVSSSSINEFLLVERCRGMDIEAMLDKVNVDFNHTGGLSQRLETITAMQRSDSQS